MNAEMKLRNYLYLILHENNSSHKKEKYVYDH